MATSSMTARPVAEVRLDHLIVFARDVRASAEFFAEMFGLVAPVVAGSFVQVRLTDGRILDVAVVRDGWRIWHIDQLPSEPDDDEASATPTG